MGQAQKSNVTNPVGNNQQMRQLLGWQAWIVLCSPLCSTGGSPTEPCTGGTQCHKTSWQQPTNGAAHGLASMGCLLPRLWAPLFAPQRVAPQSHAQGYVHTGPGAHPGCAPAAPTEPWHRAPGACACAAPTPVWPCWGGAHVQCPACTQVGPLGPPGAPQCWGW